MMKANGTTKGTSHVLVEYLEVTENMFMTSYFLVRLSFHNP